MNVDKLDRITEAAAVMGAKPCIREMRITVSMIVGQLANGYSVEQLLTDYPHLEREDVMQALTYATSPDT